MSASNKNRSKSRASKSKRTQIYTPDSAPIIYNDMLNELDTKCEDVTTTESKPSDVSESNSSATFKKDSNVVETSETKNVTRDLSFLTNKVPCKIVGTSPYKARTTLTVKELVHLVLNNSVGLYSVITSEQTRKQIINFIKTATNSELECNLNNSQKSDRIKRFEADASRYRV